VFARLLGVFAAGALLAAAAGAQTAAGDPVGPSCAVNGSEYVCIGTRPRHVVASVSSWVAGAGFVIFKRKGDPWEQRIAEFSVVGTVPIGTSPAYGESPELKPGAYYVYAEFGWSCQFGCITMMAVFATTVRVPVANIARHAVQVNRR
jgi:hypothetical protein